MGRYDDKFQKWRLKQPQSELDRKADKAWRRKGNIWTQEEIDAARKRADELCRVLNWN